MKFAFIKNSTCINIVVFDSVEVANSFKQILSGDIDDIVLLEEGYGIGDKYENGIWEKQEPMIEKEKSEIEMLKEEINELKQTIAALTGVQE